MDGWAWTSGAAALVGSVGPWMVVGSDPIRYELYGFDGAAGIVTALGVVGALVLLGRGRNRLSASIFASLGAIPIALLAGFRVLAVDPVAVDQGWSAGWGAWLLLAACLASAALAWRARVPSTASPSPA